MWIDESLINLLMFFSFNRLRQFICDRMRAAARGRWLTGMFTNCSKRSVWQVGWHLQIIHTDGGSVLLLTSSFNINYSESPARTEKTKKQNKKAKPFTHQWKCWPKSGRGKYFKQKGEWLLANTTIVKGMNREQTGDTHFAIEDMNFFESRHSEAYDGKKKFKTLISEGS